MNESPKTCLKCLQHLQDIEKNYRQARSRVSSTGLVLSPFILAPNLDLDAVLERVPDYAEDFVDNYRSERLLVLERLRLLHRMQKSLLEDFGKAKSWQDLWNDTSATEQPQGYGREQENGKGHEESKDYSEQSEAKEKSANVPTAKVYQDARIEDAESHKAHEKSRKSRPKRSGRRRPSPAYERGRTCRLAKFCQSCLLSIGCQHIDYRNVQYRYSERETPFRALTGFSILETIVRLTIRFLITPAAGIACAEPLPKNPRVMAAMLGNSGSRFCPELETIMHA
ncbi:unnamed protein product [Aureobasidium pullulans]|nr:unnamed protein product [Aureobasidium pullulans]